MRNNPVYKFIITLSLIALAVSCQRNDVIDNFEDGSLGNWVIDGNAFTHTPVLGTSTPNVSGYRGSYYMSSKNMGTTINGQMTSASFVITKDFINLLLGGTPSSSASVELLVDGEVVKKSRPFGDNPNILRWISWDVDSYKGVKANIRLRAAFNEQHLGVIYLDQIEVGNKAKSTFKEVYTETLTANKRWLLVPAEDGGTSSKMSIVCKGKNILTVPQVITPARAKIDYYIPIDLLPYQGNDIDVVITDIDKNDLVFENFQLSDTYDFLYEEPYRQLWHMTPYYGWTNDPNGMVYHNGEYHLAYQFNPYGTRHNNMHWGQVISKDLVHWEHYPFIIAPDSLGAVFSGSSVVDETNASGFGKQAIVAMYTSAGGRNYEIQQQSLAYSTDNGRLFTKYADNPVLSDSLRADFRDPKVIRYKDKWILSLATGWSISFFSSKDLKHWDKLSEFGSGMGSHAGVWECPDLMKFTINGVEKWVLLVSINPGGPHGGSATQYFIGQFDGKEFIADPLDYPLWLDAGKDNYAGVTFSNIPDRHVFMGWMSNWLYANDTPTQYFRNSMTMPRELSLKDFGHQLQLVSSPVKEIRDFFVLDRVEQPVISDGMYSVDPILIDNPGAYRIDFTITTTGKGKFGFSLLNTQDEVVHFVIDAQTGTLSMDRSRSGNVSFHPDFASEVVTSPIPIRDTYKMELYMDKHSSELFINDGETSFTNILFPTSVYNKIRWIAEGCSINITDIQIFKMSNNK